MVVAVVVVEVVVVVVVVVTAICLQPWECSFEVGRLDVPAQAAGAKD